MAVYDYRSTPSQSSRDTQRDEIGAVIDEGSVVSIEGLGIVSEYDPMYVR